MDEKDLADRYLQLAENLHLTGRDLQQMLDRVEDLLHIRAVVSIDGAKIPSSRTLITDKGAEVINRDGSRETITRHVDTSAVAAEHADIDLSTVSIPRRKRGTGTISVSRTNPSMFKAEVIVGGSSRSHLCKTLEEAESFLADLLAREHMSAADEVGNLMRDVGDEVEYKQQRKTPARSADKRDLRKRPRVLQPDGVSFLTVTDAIKAALQQSEGTALSVVDIRERVNVFMQAEVAEYSIDALCYALARREPSYAKAGKRMWMYSSPGEPCEVLTEHQSDEPSYGDGLWARAVSAR